MKKLFQILFLFQISFSLLAQEGNYSPQEKNYSMLTKNTWSLTSGVNMIYPTVSEYRYVIEEKNPNFYYDFIVRPHSSNNSYVQLAYCHVLSSNAFSSFSISPSIAHTRHTYKSSSEGLFYGGDPVYTYFEGTIKSSQISDNLALSFGFSGNIKLFKKGPVWSNQLGVGWDFPLHEKSVTDRIDNQNGSKTFEDNHWDFEWGYFVFYYQAGFSFRLTKRLYLSPGGRIPIVEIGKGKSNLVGSPYKAEADYHQIYKKAIVSATLILLIKNK